MPHSPSCRKAQSGFPSPAEDYIEKNLSLDEYLITKPTSTFFIRVKGHSMSEAHILDGDLLIIDRSLNPKPGSVILATVSGNFTLRYYKKKEREVVLEAANPNFPLIHITEEMDFQIWGVVAHVIHSL